MRPFLRAMRPARLATALPLLAVLAAGGDMAAKAQSPEPLPDAAASTPTELENALQKKRDDTRAELEALSQTMTLSTDKVKALEDGIAALDKSSARRSQGRRFRQHPRRRHGNRRLGAD